MIRFNNDKADAEQEPHYDIIHTSGRQSIIEGRPDVNDLIGVLRQYRTINERELADNKSFRYIYR
jgi:hypothetical protein